MRKLFALFFMLTPFFCSSVSFADPGFVQRKDVQQFIQKMANEHGFQKNELIALMDTVTLQPQIIDSMNRPYEQKNWDEYKQIFLTPQRIQGGIEFWRDNQKSLEKAEKLYDVPANVIVAIIGVETLYGKNQGGYRVLDALSTLAFNYPKRSVFFTKELGEYLLLCREQQVSPGQHLGSYAGAMGKPQFMPSSYRYYAANFDGDPKKDLMNDNNAVIASVANYFHKHGWANNQGVAQPAAIRGNGYKRLNTSFKNAVYSISHLTAMGVKPVTAAENQPGKAGLIKLITQHGQEFWLAYPNFYVITRYNTSPQYALAVYLLSQQLKNQWAQASITKKFAFA